MEFLQVIINEIFRQPAILLALIAMVGLILQKKSFNDIVKGTLLTAIGVVILTFGTDTIVGSIVPIQTAMSTLVLTTEATAVVEKVDILGQYGGAIGISMLLAFLINVLVARFTKIKHIFLTGHMLFWFPFVFVAVGVENGLSDIGIIVFSTIASAFYFIVMPALLTPFVQKVTGDKSFTIGHPTGILSLIAASVAKFVGNTKTSTEDLKLPASLGFFREVSITGGIVVFIVYMVVGMWLGKAALDATTELTLFTYAMTKGLTFGAALTITLTGVRMMIQQILPAFKGISDKLVPDAIPALDCPIIFNYRPNAVLIGFIVAMIVSTATIVVFNTWFNMGVILLPLVITSFFECGTAAVLAEGQGGLRGSIIGTAVASFVMVLLLAVSVPVFSNTISEWMMIFGGNDLSLFGWLADLVAKLFGGV